MKQLLIYVFLFATYTPLTAQSVSWTGATGSDWNSAGNWTPGTVPARSGKANIPGMASDKYPRLSSSVSINTLELSGGSLYTNNHDLNFTFEEAVVRQPVTYRTVADEEQVIFDKLYRPQNPGKPYSLQKSLNTTAPIHRFEIRKGENWETDIKNKNTHNNAVKERTELYLRKAQVPFDRDVWISYSLFIEPGEDIIFSNPAYYVDLGQWHHSGLSGGPPFNFNFSGQGNIRLETRGQGNRSNAENNSKPPQPVTRAQVDLKRGIWNHFVVRVKFNKTAGQIQWWVNGAEICNISDINLGYAEPRAGYWKFGIYRTTHQVPLIASYANMEVDYDGVQPNLYTRVNSPLPVE